MPNHSFVIAAIGLLAGCQSQRGPTESVAECRGVIGRFEAALNGGDRTEFDRSVFCADETETSFRAAMFDLFAADRNLNRRGRETFSEEWSSIKERAGLKGEAENYSDRPILILSDSAALAQAVGKGNDLYLIRLGERSERRWQIQAASLFGRSQSREVNVRIARIGADEYASIARRLGGQIKTENEFRQAMAEAAGLIMFGDRTMIKYSPKVEIHAATEPIVIPSETFDEKNGRFMGVSGKRK